MSLTIFLQNWIENCQLALRAIAKRPIFKRCYPLTEPRDMDNIKNASALSKVVHITEFQQPISSPSPLFGFFKTLFFISEGPDTIPLILLFLIYRQSCNLYFESASFNISTLCKY